MKCGLQLGFTYEWKSRVLRRLVATSVFGGVDGVEETGGAEEEERGGV